MNKIIKKAITISCLAFLGGCSESGLISDHNGSTVKFPLFDICESKVVSDFNEYINDNDFEFKYKIEKFDSLMISHPEIIGFVVISSSEYNRGDLIAMANKPMLECYPTSSFTLSLNDPDFAQNFLQNKEFDMRRGISGYYPLYKDNELEFFYREKYKKQ